jgi:hypothetical protein
LGLIVLTLIVVLPVQAQDFSFVSGSNLVAGNNPVGVVVVDVNRDAISDLVVLNRGSGTVSTFLGSFSANNVLSFSQPSTTLVGANPIAMASGDFNSDGFPDFVVANQGSDSLSILMGGSNGILVNWRTINSICSGPSSVAIGRFNGDAFEDVAVACFNDNVLKILFGVGDGTFGVPVAMSTGFDPITVLPADIDLDGITDLVIGNNFDGNASLFLGSPNGTFSEYPPFLGSASFPGVTSGLTFDLDNNGIDDIAVVDPPTNNFTLMINKGTSPPTFFAPRDVSVGVSGMNDIAVGDFNADGSPDLVVPTSAGIEIFEYRSLPGGSTVLRNGTLNPRAVTPTLTLTAGTGPRGVAVADLDGDGRQDIVVANSGGNTITFFLNKSINKIVPQTGWWWDNTLSGTGFFVETGGVSGKGIFTAGFLYDASGNATWLVSTGPMSGLAYSGSWLKVNGGGTLTGPYKAPTGTASAGNIGLQFIDAYHAILTRPDGSKIKLHRFSFTASTVPAAPVAGAAQSGWWWADPNGAGNGTLYGSGTGYGIEIQGSNVFIVAYSYDSAGSPVWYLATGGLTSPSSYSGSWDAYRGGPQLTSREGKYAATKSGSAGPMSLTFSDSTHGTLTMGNVVIPIVRFQQY